ncbi:hypothetical protein EYB25_009415 [Talaromyces marneffei]|uniref:uncharacterized protein n=1 Tax=Talaromyces marneffei TaxID=37727 RepID=UPI0012AA1B3C|nr:uncharacterized protein EYB26_008677 [Talaromyces marneffei]KAE8547622.1 hypothetical protein EYB25_009415 [Talaromyces marneffei]QGA20967.1 hypothetical protein EYB26_008677 [Talaromyces marneffei]
MDFALAFVSLITAASASCIYGTSLMPRAAEGVVDILSFNYTATGGPLNWHLLNTTANNACATGKNQSPVDIVMEGITYAIPGSVKLDIPCADGVELENLNNVVEVVANNGTLTTPESIYKLAQFHFHTPSEHRVNEEYFPMEAHFVFENEASQIAVAAFLFQLSESGASNPLFDSVFAHLDDITTPGTFTKTGPLDFTTVNQHFSNHGIFQYSGSLTTPPCSEGLSWYISTEPMPLNVQTYNKVKKVVKFNARYTQNTLGQNNLLELAATPSG